MDPLNINYLAQSRALLHSIPPDVTPRCAGIISTIEQLILERPVQASLLLPCLSDALATPELTWLVARNFRPILMDLAVRWLHTSTTSTIGRLSALAFLLNAHEELYPILIHLLDAAPSVEAFLSPSLTGGPRSPPPEAVHAILLTCYRLLTVNPSFSVRLGLPQRTLKTLFEHHTDRGVRLLAIQCFAMQGGLSEAQQGKLVEAFLGGYAENDAQIHMGVVIGEDLPKSQSPLVDGWTLSLFELQRIEAMRSTLSDNAGFYEWTQLDRDAAMPLKPADLSSHIVSVSGVLVMRHETTPDMAVSVATRSFVVTKSAEEALRELSLHYSQKLACLITSSPSSGKTAILQHLASLVHGTPSQVVSVHLADSSLDAKSLLGSYVSSSTSPGTFDWVDGPLVRAMKLGRWLVLEDVDRAGQDVLSTLLPLLERMGPMRKIGARPSIDVPGRGRVYASDEFMVFATRSIPALKSIVAIPSGSRLFPRPTFFGAQHFSEITLRAPSSKELPFILQGVYPDLHPSAIHLLISVWTAAREATTYLRQNAKEVELIALLKLCQRVVSMSSLSEEMRRGSLGTSEVVLSRSTQEEVFLEALDIFAGHISEQTTEGNTSYIINSVAAALNVSDEHASWILSQRTPEFRVPEHDASAAIVIGRIATHPKPRPMNPTGLTRPFALHRQSLRLLEQLAVATHVNEPVLLVGETGTGKTAAVQHLALVLGRPLTALNLSMQTETADIVGGLKPVDPRIRATLLHERYMELFSLTFSRKKNVTFADSVRKAFVQGKWRRLSGLWRDSARLALEQLSRKGDNQLDESSSATTTFQPRKRRKVTATSLLDAPSSIDAWTSFAADVTAFEAVHLDQGARFVFAFAEGPLVAAIRKGEWILLDEINLASPDVLESILSILEGPCGSLTLTERGDLQPVPRHNDFRLFACMNPATDVGKRDLPPRLRRHFTEIYVPPPEVDRNALLAVVEQYLGDYALGDRSCLLDVVEFYLAVKSLASSGTLADGANQAPHYNMRTLTRAMMYASQQTSSFGLRRALWEGCLMCFTMALDQPSSVLVRRAAETHLLATVKNPRSLLRQMPTSPGEQYSHEFAPFFLEKGALPVPSNTGDYVMTPSVRAKLLDLARIVGAAGLPVLIQGPTSSGKTSSIEYLARRTGHRFVRINNHDHTDIQEYLGSYISDPGTGKLVYRDGLLVRALRNGDWIVLDELNLAPSDVLEALNRLLDDNRELVIPETGEVIRPHRHFALFATQNPPGLYGGRKPLSRAFRNRFVEVHFEDVPENELEVILCERCKIAPSYSKRIVTVFQELRRRRQASRVFETKDGFATLRDLFRWANRGASTVMRLAEDGYMLLAERARRPDDKETVREVLEEVLKVTLNPGRLYGDNELLAALPPGQLVWTSAVKRLWCLVVSALRNNEPVLLVGETGTGKTTVCELLAAARQSPLFSVSCHLNTETGDLIGGLRPLRDKAFRRSTIFASLKAAMERAEISTTEYGTISPVNVQGTLDVLNARANLPVAFRAELARIRQDLAATEGFIEWKDGPLVEAMRCGGFFLLDEISLADDAVLERLNSVLEPSRSLVLAEMGGRDHDQLNIVAQPGFQFLATMNPGGDYGKKELSPALRNRFTEIYVPSVTSTLDRSLIITSSWSKESLRSYTESLLAFWDWVEQSFQGKASFGLRDILAWITFMNRLSCDSSARLTEPALFHHAARMAFVDALGFMNTSLSDAEGVPHTIHHVNTKLLELVPLNQNELASLIPALQTSTESFSIGPFSLLKGPATAEQTTFTFVAPTTHENTLRVLRAAQLTKPILLEGSPGVGKTSLVTALANAAGRSLCRINLSDQTELTDLFGSDLPVEGGQPGEFGWKSAAFLRSMETGNWVLLDEMNLAPQPVLEGLNAVLDHRGRVYIPELGKTFHCHPEFRVFAAQNPLQQGGDRKGLPKSFLNRFTRVYMAELTDADYLAICRNLHPDLPADHLERLIHFNRNVIHGTTVTRVFSNEGSPWEFNLRDLLRWLQLYRLDEGVPLMTACYRSFEMLYLARLRSSRDREQLKRIFLESFAEVSKVMEQRRPWFELTEHYAQFGHVVFNRSGRDRGSEDFAILHSQLDVLQHAAACIEEGWMLILTGPAGAGKSSAARLLARACGRPLVEFSMNSTTDASDLLGGFEQWNDETQTLDLYSRINAYLDACVADNPDRQELVDSNRLRVDSVMNSSLHALNVSRLASLAAVCLQIVNWLLEVQSGNPSQLNSVRQEVQSYTVPEAFKSRFKWSDGPFVQAMREGHWLLIDNANLCNSAVLDRLNSVLEDNGTLLLNERGLVDNEVQEIKPHPSFRVIMIVDPHYGELSRAMRNRGVEVFVPNTFDSDVDRLRLRWLARCIRCPPSSSPTLFDPVLHSKRARLGLVASPPGEDGNVALATAPFSSLLFRESKLARQIIPTQVANLTEGWEAAGLGGPAAIYVTQATRQVDQQLLRRVRMFLASYVQMMLPNPLEVPDFVHEFIVRHRVMVGERLSIPTAFICGLPLDPGLNPLFDFTDATATLWKETFCADLVQILSVAADSPERNQAMGDEMDVHDLGPHDSITEEAVNVLAVVKSSLIAFGEHVLMSAETSLDFERHTRLLEDLADFSQQLESVLTESTPNYSAISVVSGWFASNALLSHPSLSTMSTAVAALQKSLTPRIGAEMFSIWWQTWNWHARTGLMHSVPFRLLKEYTMSNEVNHFPQLTDVRSSLLHVLSNDERGLTEPGHVSTFHFTPEGGVRGPQVGAADAWTIALAGLHFIGLFPSRQSQPLLESMCEVAASTPAYPLLQLASWKRGLSVYQKDEIPREAYTPHLTLQWLESFKLSWTGSDYMIDLDAGLMFSPIELETCLQLLTQPLMMESLKSFKEAIQRRARHCAVVTLSHSSSRLAQLRLALIRSLQNVCAGFATSYNADVLRRLLDFLVAEDREEGDWNTWLKDMQETSNVHLARVLRSHVSPALVALFQSSSSYADDIANLGRAWIAVARAVLELYLPNIPRDPLATMTSRISLLRQRNQSIIGQLRFHQRAEWFANGHDSNPRTIRLQQRRTETEIDISDVATPPISRPSDPKLLNALFGEFEQFIEQVLVPERIDNLIEGVLRADPQASLIARTVHRSIDAFVRRISHTYGQLSDVSFTAILSIQMLQLGLKFVERAGRLRMDIASARSRGNLSLSMTQFPLVAAPYYALRTEKSNRVILDSFTTKGVVLGLCSVVRRHHIIGLSISDMDLVLRLYDVLLLRWSEKREKEEATRLRNESLYRTRKDDYQDESEEDKAERELRILFPDFEEEEVSAGRDMQQEKTTEPHQLEVTASDTRRVWTIHRMIFSAPTHPFDGPLEGAHDLAYSLQMEQLTDYDFRDCTDELDSGSHIFRLSCLHKAISNLGRTGVVVSTSYDFYRGENISELEKAFGVLSDLHTKLAELIPLWPEQAQLPDISDRCEAVLHRPLKSSLAQVLPGLESLVGHIATWEEFSHRENSLAAYQQQLVGLIVEWRRMELNCWAQILDSESSSYSEQVAEWWFPVYTATVHLSPTSAQKDLKELVSLLDDFLTSSPLGQFQGRLDLVASFAEFLRKLGYDDAAFAERARVTSSIVAYYGQFEVAVRHSLSSQRKPLEDDIRGFIQLASWKDVNVSALKQSAQKTHRRLYQTIHKFRSILHQPVAPLLSISEQDGKGASERRSKEANFRLPGRQFPPPSGMLQLDNAPVLALSTAWIRLRDLCASELCPFVGDDTATEVEMMATSIIDTVANLSSETRATTKQGTLKALTAKKRKAWYDALRDLKSIGLSSRLQPKVLLEQTERATLLGHSSPNYGLSDQSPFAEVVRQTDAYFGKLCGTMPFLRSALVSHQKDLPIRDLQRAAGYVESAFALSLKGRRILRQACHAFDMWQRILDRITSIVGVGDPAPKVAACGLAAEHAVQSVCALATDFSSGLQEILTGMDLLRTYADTEIPYQEVVARIELLLESQKTLATHLSSIRATVGRTKPPILLSSEYSALEDARRSMHESCAFLLLISREHPEYASMFDPAARWLSDALCQPNGDSETFPGFTAELEPPARLCNSLIAAVLAVAQHLSALAKEQDHDDQSDFNIQVSLRSAERVMEVLQLDSVGQLTTRLLSALTGEDMTSTESLLLVAPFLQEYGSLLGVAINNLLQLNKSTFKLTHVLCATLRDVATNGFCKPEGQDESIADGTSKGAVEGTGIGEGTGTEDVSAEIQDESQVEGTQQEAKDTSEEQGDTASHEDEAFEMEQDFDGDLEAGPDRESDDGQSEHDSQSSALEETTGRLDPLDPASLDEKMWGDKQPEADSHSEENLTKAPDQAAQSDEVGARGEDHEAAHDMETEVPQPEEPMESELSADQEPSGVESGEEEAANPLRADEQVAVGETLNLPEDLDLGGERDSASEAGSLEEPLSDSDLEGNPDDNTPARGDHDDTADTPDIAPDSVAVDDTDIALTDIEAHEEGQAERNSGEGVPTKSQMGVTGDPGESEGDTDSNSGQNEESIQAPVDDKRQPTAGMDTTGDNEATELEQRTVNQEPRPQRPAGDEHPEQPPSREMETQDQSQRMPGDARHEVIRSSEQIQRGQPQTTDMAESADPGPLEWAQKDDFAPAQQALGPREDDKGITLDELKLVDDAVEDEDMDWQTTQPDLDQTMKTESESMLMEQETTTLPPNSDLRGAVPKWSTSNEEAAGEAASDAEFQSEMHASRNIDIKDDNELQQAASRWQTYASATQELAYSLCEQLRLILEPTRATRLQGDYKTGKRLNMKKIIPYIASDFTKDKIWLRRTKPSRREYQVLIALDDSRSMAESRSVSLAFQTLSLVSSALGKLEVGDVGIMRFGESVEVIHDFESGPVTGEVGERIISHFNFAQTGTNMEKLLESSIGMLGEARARAKQMSFSSSELWQLEIIISDGVCQGHERLRSLIRRAEEEKIVIVFVVLDSLHFQRENKPQDGLQGSIMSMMQGKYAEVDGRMEIKMERYMDTFPFEYYIVLRDVESLPDVLASTLRQFFEIR